MDDVFVPFSVGTTVRGHKTETDGPLSIPTSYDWLTPLFWFIYTSSFLKISLFTVCQQTSRCFIGIVKEVVRNYCQTRTIRVTSWEVKLKHSDNLKTIHQVGRRIMTGTTIWEDRVPSHKDNVHGDLVHVCLTTEIEIMVLTRVKTIPTQNSRMIFRGLSYAIEVYYIPEDLSLSNSLIFIGKSSVMTKHKYPSLLRGDRIG